MLAVAEGAHRKTRYDLIMVRLDGQFVSMDARLPAHLFQEAVASGELPAFAGYDEIRREVRLGSSRLDFLLSGGGRRCWVEVKSVTLVEAGIGLFPDAPTTRGQRHVWALQRAVAAGDRAAVVFVVQREDACLFAPHDAADPALGAALRQAAQVGVEVHAVNCRVRPDEVRIKEPIPVRL